MQLSLESYHFCLKWYFLGFSVIENTVIQWVFISSIQDFVPSSIPDGQSLTVFRCRQVPSWKIKETVRPYVMVLSILFFHITIPYCKKRRSWANYKLPNNKLFNTEIRNIFNSPSILCLTWPQVHRVCLNSHKVWRLCSHTCWDTFGICPWSPQ
jgi:hypothetical protein